MLGAMVLTLLGGLWLLTLHVSTSGSFPRPLTAKQERDCLERMSRGDRAARNELVEHNLRLVAHIVKKYYAVSGEQDDLISIGTIGLIKAVETYNLEKKTKFATYASRCIENEILMYFRARRKTAGDVSLEDPLDTDRDGNSLTLMELVSDEEDIITRLDLTLKAEKLREVFGVLEGREQRVLRLREDGTWVRDMLTGCYPGFRKNAFPQSLTFETDGVGYITAVRFQCGYTAQGGMQAVGDPDVVWAGYAYIHPLLLCMMAGPGAQEGGRLLHPRARDIIALVNESWYQGLTYDAGSTHTAARVSCWGYLREGEDTMLIPVEDSCQFTGEFAIVWK